MNNQPIGILDSGVGGPLALVIEGCPNNFDLGLTINLVNLKRKLEN